MYTQVKNKGSGKKKTKKKISSTERKIPEASDCQETGCIESVAQKHDSSVSDLFKEYEKNIKLPESQVKQENTEADVQTKNEFDNKTCEIEEKHESNENLQILQVQNELEKSTTLNITFECKSIIGGEESTSNDIQSGRSQNSFVESESKIINYNDLILQIGKLKVQNDPSAPSGEEKCVEPFNEKRFCRSEKILDIRKSDYSITLKSVLSPFGKDKLCEFYSNSELIESKAYMNEFLNNEINDEIKTNKLYKLLVEYVLLREQIKLNKKKVQDFNERLNACVSLVWSVWKDVEITEEIKCRDGNTVVVGQKYTQAEFNTDTFSEIDSILMQIKHTLYNVYVVDYFKCSISKFKIEYYLQCLLMSCDEFNNLNEEAPVVLSSPSIKSYFRECLLNLKTAISVLFIFQRKQLRDVDKDFIEEVRQWLSDLVAVLLRVGNWKDHAFLLHHIMRCPGGISEWAPQYVQFPQHSLEKNSFFSPEINHMMVIMNILLNPVEERPNFIKKWETDLENDINLWTIIDSDGEIENDTEQPYPLKENDLVSLLNQIPFSYLFKNLLHCVGTESEHHTVTSEYFLKLLSFLTEFVEIIHCGLKEYCTHRYRQFIKRLGRLIYHSVQYATDMLILLKTQKHSDDEMLRIQVEYDSFFFKSINFIYSAKKHGTWQFLASMPYESASFDTVLKLFGMFQLNKNLEDSFIRINFSNFEEEFLKLPEEEQFYLLTTFGNMALALDKSEIQFIRNILYQLFYIGFLSTSTQDHCYKNINSLLCSICSSYPFLMSDILHIQKNIFFLDPSHNQKLSCYLWVKLPVDMWQPNKEDLETLSYWLLEPIENVANELARIILKSLNYGMHQGELFMPVQSHHSIAKMVLRSNIHFVSDNEAGIIRNMSNLVRSQTIEQLLNDWTWNILFKLRLHMLDQSEATICKIFHNLPDCLKDIPNIESDFELHQLVLRKHPVAIFIALMTTTLGHSVPLIFDNGFELIEILLNVGRFEAAVICLEYMTLFFVECSDSLYKCEKFIYILSRLINSENSYIQFAKNLISNSFPGPILKCVEVMLQNQINYCKTLNFTKFGNIISLWLLSLTEIPMWNLNPSILYLIDKVLQNSFFDEVSDQIVTVILQNLLDKSIVHSDPKNSFSSLVSWMNSKYNPPSLLSKGFNGNVPWFSYKVIQMEHENFEKKNLIWSELLKELHCSSEKKTNIDNSLKKVCTALEVPVRPSNVLAIYKWSNQILETDFSHPLLPLIWERFFSLYLCRVPTVTDHGSVGIKFFDGVVNQSLFNRLKQRLKETCDHFKELTASEDMKRNNYFKILKLFQTYSLWLDDSKLHERCLNVHMLSMHYSPNLLELLLNNNQSPWMEILEYGSIEENFRQCSLYWSKIKNRCQSEKTYKHNKQKQTKSLLERINERFESYETPVPPPRLRSSKYNFRSVTFDTLMHSHKMIIFIKPHLNKLEEHIKQYLAKLNENILLETEIKKLLPHLYITIETQKVLKAHCGGFSKSSGGRNVNYSCSGPAILNLKFKESKINSQVNQSFGQCKKDFDKNIINTLSFLSPSISESTVLLDIVIEELKKEYNLIKTRDELHEIFISLRKTGVDLFYELLERFCGSFKHAPFLESIFTSYVDELGKTFIEENEGEIDRVFNLVLNDNNIGGTLCGYFTPNVSSTFGFIEFYSITIKSNSERKFITLSRFDISLWLSNHKPKVSEISHLLSVVCWGLKTMCNKSNGEENTLKLLNYHLELLLMYDFPEHYGQVLNFLIDASESQSVSTDTWFSFLNSLAWRHPNVEEKPISQNNFDIGQTIKKLKLNFIKYANEQNLFSLGLIKGTISLLASTFKNERLKIGPYGLYRKYLSYVEPIFTFFGMLSYSLITKEIEDDVGSLSDKIVQQLWPLLSDLFSPWLIPYLKENFMIQTAQIFRSHNFDQFVLLPWSTDYSCYAFLCVSIFIDSIRFVYDTLPGSNNILSYIWNFYVNNFAQIYVKDYILNVIHDSFVSLPWDSFFPNLQDVELMLRIVDQFLPLSHSFLGNIFVNIKWTYLVQYYLESYDNNITTKLHICLLHLLVKLPLEPTLKQNDKITALLIEANDYAWHLIDSDSYEIILNWFVPSCDPRIILMDERLEHYKLDSTILRLLRSCAGYVSSNKLFHPNTSIKRILFIRTCIKWLITSNQRFKCKDSPLFKKALCTLWEDIEMIVTQNPSQHEKIDDVSVLFAEFFLIFTENELISVVETNLSIYFLNQKSRLVIFGIIHSAGISIENPKIFGSVVETALENYFNFTENSEWSEIIKNMVPVSKSGCSSRLEKVLIDNNYLLTLYGLSLKNFHECPSQFTKVILSEYYQLLLEAKPGTSIEPKFVLLIVFCMELIAFETKNNAEERILHLTKMFNISSDLLNDKRNGFLSALGLKKTFSNRFKLICLIICSGITVFFKKNYPQQIEKVDENILLQLDLADSNKTYHSIQRYTINAKNTIREFTTLEQIISFIKIMSWELFNASYLK